MNDIVESPTAVGAWLCHAAIGAGPGVDEFAVLVHVCVCEVKKEKSLMTFRNMPYMVVRSCCKL